MGVPNLVSKIFFMMKMLSSFSPKSDGFSISCIIIFFLPFQYFQNNVFEKGGIVENWPICPCVILPILMSMKSLVQFLKSKEEQRYLADLGKLFFLILGCSEPIRVIFFLVSAVKLSVKSIKSVHCKKGRVNKSLKIIGMVGAIPHHTCYPPLVSHECKQKSHFSS